MPCNCGAFLLRHIWIKYNNSVVLCPIAQHRVAGQPCNNENPNKMTSQKNLTNFCQCKKHQIPLVIRVDDPNPSGSTKLQLTCPFSSTGQCGFPHQLQGVTTPFTA
jgi:hypothetical protein